MAIKSSPKTAPTTKSAARLKNRYVYQALMISIAVILGILVTHLLLRQLLVREALAEEADFFWKIISENPEAALPATKNLRAYLLPRDGAELPQAAHNLTLGYHEYHHLENFNIAYLTEDDSGQRLLILFNRSGVDSLVLLFGILPLSIALIVLYTSLYISYRFSIKLLSPAKYLADKIRNTDLRTIGKQDFINEQDAEKYDNEIQTIAEAIGELAGRIHLFIERETHFTRDVSHELRSSITVMTMAAELLSVDDLTAKQQSIVAKISHAAKDMKELTEFFLLLAREESITQFQQKINVNRIVQKETEKLSLMTDKRKVPIIFDNRAQCTVIGSEQVLSVLSGNLLRNALLYTDKGTVTIIVDARYMAVSDTGIGISSDEVSTVFNDFERGSSENIDRPKGYGVGLAIVKRLCDRFSWKIELESEKGKGTSVKVQFVQ